MIKTRNIGIQRAKQILQEISLPETVREIIEDQRKRKMDRRAEDAYVFDQGKEQGIELGKEQGIELGKEQGIELGKEQGSEIGQERMARLWSWHWMIRITGRSCIGNTGFEMIRHIKGDDGGFNVKRI